MTFENLNERQTELVMLLIERLASEEFEPEFISYVNSRGCFVKLRAENREDDEVSEVQETDLLYLAEAGYITLVKTLETRQTATGKMPFVD